MATEHRGYVRSGDNNDVPVHYQHIRVGRDYFLGATVHFTNVSPR